MERMGGFSPEKGLLREYGGLHTPEGLRGEEGRSALGFHGGDRGQADFCPPEPSASRAASKGRKCPARWTRPLTDPCRLGWRDVDRREGPVRVLTASWGMQGSGR